MTVSLGLVVREMRSALDRQVGEARAVGAAGKAALAREAALTASAELHERVAGVLTKLGEERQDAAQRQVEELVTRGLQVIFHEGLSFHLVQSVRAGQAQVDFVVRSVHGESATETPVMDAQGGGLAAVTGFLLRLVVLLLTPGARRFLALDESFAHVSAEFEPRVAEFLREVADKAGVQILMVSHSTAYDDVADKRYRFSLDRDGVTTCQEL